MGEATITLADGTLVFTGKRGGELRVVPSAVQRLRAGIEPSKHGKLYCARLWLEGDQRPIVIWANRSSADAYVPMIRDFGVAVAAAGRLDRLERGTTKFSAAMLLGLMGILTIAAFAISIFVLSNEAWYVRFTPAILPTVMTVLSYFLMRRSLPSPVASLEEFKAAVDGSRR
jgi:hypothetical protein